MLLADAALGVLRAGRRVGVQADAGPASGVGRDGAAGCEAGERTSGGERAADVFGLRAPEVCCLGRPPSRLLAPCVRGRRSAGVQDDGVPHLP